VLHSTKSFVFTIFCVFCIAAGASAQTTTSKKFSAIDDMSGWGGCDVCSGPKAQGASIVYWLAQHQTSPSKDGGSNQYFVGGTTPYGSALWWKQLGPYDAARHFNLEMDYYFKNQSGPQALEIDAAQSLNGKKFFFGTECDVLGTYKNTWLVNDYVNHKWVPTGIPCYGTTAGKWHHLKWEFERTTDGRTHFVAVTVDSVRQVVNRYFQAKSSSAHELNVAFQLDGNKDMTDFSVWVDNLSLSCW
jgi:hypothetical protein